MGEKESLVKIKLERRRKSSGTPPAVFAAQTLRRLTVHI
jgi:hypothetical protein